MCFCVYVQQLSSEVTFEIDIFHAGLPWHCLDQTHKVNKVKVVGQNRLYVKVQFKITENKSSVTTEMYDHRWENSLELKTVKK